MTRQSLPRLALSAGLYLVLGHSPAAAQPSAIDNNAANASSMVVRSTDGRLQLTAVRSEVPVKVDGTLDDPVWLEAKPAVGFVQSEPVQGDPATERTEAFVAFDSDTLYVAAYCYDSEPGMAVLSELRKDFASGEQDSFEVIFDTFGDRRNGFMFITNRGGARSDMQVANEGRENNASWDAVWTVKAQNVENGWTVEMAIPFKSLRFEGAEERIWGINFSRVIRHKNEIVYWSPVPRAYNLSRVSEAGNLVGLPALNPGRNLRIKPYLLGRSVREVGDDTYDPDAEVGLDVKYGLTPSLTLDVTLNPDFAQVEADEQQVNLTQFSLFFPEKREFFLENSGIFYVGDAQRLRRNPTPTPDEDLLLFFSRRIGLTGDGRPIPILGGARLTGAVAGISLGAMTMQTRSFDQLPPNNYSVVRARKNVFSNSDVGAIFMSRQNTDRGGDFNRVYGVDATMRLFGKLDWNSYAVRTDSPGGRDGEYAVRSAAIIQERYYQVRAGLMRIGEGFLSDFSFYRRVGMQKYILETGVRPRPKAWQERGVREVHPHLNWDYQTNLTGDLIAKKMHHGVTISLNNGAYSEPAVNLNSQQLTRPLQLSSQSLPIPPGLYHWTDYTWRFNTDASRMFSVALLPTWGGLWTGTQKTIVASATIRPSYKFAATLGLQGSSVELDLPQTSFVKKVWTLRTNYSFSTNMYLDSLLQYDTDLDQFNANIRFNLIHRPLSDLFVVYNEQRFTTIDSSGDSLEPGRGFIVKFTRMFAF